MDTVSERILPQYTPGLTSASVLCLLCCVEEIAEGRAISGGLQAMVSTFVVQNRSVNFALLHH